MTLPKLARASLRFAKEIRPLSIGELVALARAHQLHGDEAEASRLLAELTHTPLVVFEHCEDLSSVVEGLTLAAAERRDDVLAILSDLLASESLSWWTTPDVIDVLEEVGGAACAIRHAAPLFEQLSNGFRDPDGEDDVCWPYVCRKFLARGWWRDLAALLSFARNETVAMSARAHSCALLIRYAAPAAGEHAAAERILARLLSSTDLELRDRTGIAAILYTERCEQQGAAWLASCLERPPAEPEDRRALARLLVRVEREEEAFALLREDDPVLVTTGFQFPDDDKLLERAIGEDQVRVAKIKRVLDAAEPLYDRLNEAVELVEGCGEPRALELLFEAASGKIAQGEDQLEAIDSLERLGFRSLSRESFERLNKQAIEPCLLAGQLMRFGRKSKAASLYLLAAQSPTECNESFILSGLADLGLSEDIVRLLKMVHRTNDH